MNIESTQQYYIYFHVDPRTNFPVYIGKGSCNRAKVMYNRNYKHKQWVKELKLLGLSPIVHIGNSFDSEEKCYEIERIEISFWNKIGIKLVNLADGGRGGTSNVCKKPIICTTTGEVYDSTIYASKVLNIAPKRINDVLRGRKLSYNGLKFIYVDEKLNELPNKKRQHAINFNIHTTSKPVICVETNITYNSITEAAKAHGVGSGFICQMLNGKVKSVKKFTFRRL